jgi:hypothetical protein
MERQKRVWEKLCSKTWAQDIFSTCRTATERENLGIWARDSLVTRKGALRCREYERHGTCYSLGAWVVVNAEM